MIRTEDEWLDRINNLIELIRECGYDTVSVNFTMRELVELRLMITTIKELRLKSEVEE